jgi:DNA-binding CsgD family transcriptional regulator
MFDLCRYRIEQLARLGLPGQIFIPAVMQELHHHVPSISNTFCWQNTDGNLNNIYDEMSNTQVIKHFMHAMESTEPDKYSHTINWFSFLDKSATSFEYSNACPYIAEFYKTVLLPLGYFNSCSVPVTSTTATRLGVLILHRKHGELEFTKKERDFCEHIARIIAYGLTQPVLEHQYIADGWVQGLLITDYDGKLEHCCSMGEKLLVLASVSQFDTTSTNTIHDLTIFEDLDTLIKQLQSSSTSTSRNHNNPTLTVNNAWGKFILHGFFIENKMGLLSQKLGFKIHWQEPFVLKLFHRIKNLKLTPRQETVGLLYAKGDAHQLIADKLNLSIHTVKEHIKNLSDRLQITSRGDLIERILCD